MPFRRIATAAPAAGLVFACVGTARAQQDHATPEEVVQRVQQAAQAVAKQGEAGLAIYSSKNDISVWKDSYVFVVTCEGGSAVTVAHPVRLELKGQAAAQTLKYGPRPGEQLGADYCTQGRKPHGGWVEYNFPKAGGTQPERKVSYFLAAQGTPYVAGAGVYDATTKIEDLEKVSGGQP
jgi:signal transduction histidine kinase